MAAMTLILSTGLAACETFDPAGWITGPVAPPERINTEGFETDAPFPKLSQVPDAPPRPTPKRDRLELADDLEAERGLAEYTTSLASPGAVQEPAVPAAQQDQIRPKRGASPSLKPTAPGPPPPPPASVVAAGTQTSGPGNLVRATPPAAAPGSTSRPAGQLVAVLYYPGSASDLKPEDGALIEEVALLHRQNGGQLRVVGHAAPLARAEGPRSWGLARLRLSLARASKVARRLNALGSASDEVIVVAAADGNRGLTAGQDDARHHRVEIFLEP